MQFTKLGHACVRLVKDGGVLVIDPGGWSGDDALDGAHAVLVTTVPGRVRMLTHVGIGPAQVTAALAGWRRAAAGLAAAR